jgi:hypothetical protein
MNPAPRPHESGQLINAIQLARHRIANAGNRLESAKAQARLAKRRRKEAKAAARRARKEVRLARKEFANAKKTLVSAEEQFAAAVEQAVQDRKRAQTRLRAKAAAVTARKKLALTPGTRHTLKPPRGKVRNFAASGKIRNMVVEH